MSEKLTLKQTAAILRVSEQRVYQLDAELCPNVVARGTKMQTRYYDPAVVERVRLARESAGIDIVAKGNTAWGKLVTQAAATNQHVEITKEQMLELSDAPCACCGAQAKPIHTLARIDNAVGYTLENLVPCCGECRGLKKGSDVRALLERSWAIVQWQTRESDQGAGDTSTSAEIDPAAG